MSKKIFLSDIDVDVKPIETSTKDNDEQSLEDQQYLYNERFKNDTTWRNILVWWVIIVDTTWLYFLLIILIRNNYCIHLSDSVLLMLLGTTTVNVLGLAFIILKGLFSNKTIN